MTKPVVLSVLCLLGIGLVWMFLANFPFRGTSTQPNVNETLEKPAVAASASLPAQSIPFPNQAVLSPRVSIDEKRQEIELLDEDDERNSSAVVFFLRDYLEEDPEAARRWVLSKSPDGIFRRGYEILGKHYGEKGMDDVSSLLDDLTNDQAYFFTKGAIPGLALRSPAQAFELKLLAEATVGRVLSDHNQIYSRAIQGDKINEAFDAVNTYVPEPTRTTDTAYIYSQWVRSSPTEAANHLLTKNYPPSKRNLYIRSFLRFWSRDDPNGLSKWLGSLKPGDKEVFETQLAELESRG